MTRFLAFAALCSLSLSACAQSAAPEATGQKITIGPKAAAEPVYVAGTPEARVRDALRRLEPKIQVESINPSPIPGFREVIATGRLEPMPGSIESHELLWQLHDVKLCVVTPALTTP